jgi:Asp-tRNA(Asn)/Glu-tRNA(Gln) amidotransferase A subunit family amidase
MHEPPGLVPQMRRRFTAVTVATVAALVAAVSIPGVSRAANPGGLDAPGFRIEEATIGDIQKALASGRLTCQQLVDMYLARITAYDKAGPKPLNAIIRINPQAKTLARQMDEEIPAKKMRPLECTPLIVKENFDTVGMPTTAGSLSLANSYPPDDAFQVMRLKQAGALVLAKSNMAEFAWSALYTISSLGGTTRNSYDLDRVPAGSSGGTGAAVSANFGVAGLGTDTGNSIRGPSSHNALVGIRSTMGATSRDGVVPLFLDRDIAGPMARTVEDATRLFNVLAGYDPNDPVTAASIGKLPTDYTRFLVKNGLKRARIGVLRTLSDTPATDPQVLALFNQSLKDMQAAGATIVDPFTVPNFAELSTNLRCDRFRYDLNNYLASLGPNAPVKSLKQIVDSGLYDPTIAQNMSNADKNTLAPQDNPACVAAVAKRQQFREAVIKAMDEAHVDAVVYPTWDNAPRLVGDLTSPDGNNSGIVAPPTGMPAMTVPMGYTYGHLPAGLQLLGRPFAEPTLIKLSYSYEQATHHRVPTPLFPPLPSEQSGVGKSEQSGGR